jgi:drug/metabolite transporter (DMT)-like permease
MVSVYSLPQLEAEHFTAVVATPVVYFAVYAVLCATVLTYSLNTWALKHTRSSQVALYINVQPLVAVALGPFFAMPAPDWRFFVALAGVATGLWLQTTAK